jgi:hypothetical protein
MFVLFRAPCMMEDEGRHFHYGTFETREEMEKAVQKELGYFSSSNFYYFHGDQRKSDFEHLKPIPKAATFMDYAIGRVPHEF